MRVVIVLFILSLFILSACAPTDKRTIKPLPDTLSDAPEWKPQLNATIEKTVFSLPDIDKKMCQTFPQLIIETLEAQKGVLDASFMYDGHIVTVIHDPQFMSKDALLTFETYDWVGVEFYSNEIIKADAELVYSQRLENNIFEMPFDHMVDEE